MTHAAQLPIPAFFSLPAPPTPTLAPPPAPVDDIPRETRDPITGALLCRHHGERIPASAYPCPRCKTEGALDPGYGTRDAADPYR